jgi:hypothetical protein
MTSPFDLNYTEMLDMLASEKELDRIHLAKLYIPHDIQLALAQDESSDVRSELPFARTLRSRANRAFATKRVGRTDDPLYGDVQLLLAKDPEYLVRYWLAQIDCNLCEKAALILCHDTEFMVRRCLISRKQVFPLSMLELLAADSDAGVRAAAAVKLLLASQTTSR